MVSVWWWLEVGEEGVGISVERGRQPKCGEAVCEAQRCIGWKSIE